MAVLATTHPTMADLAKIVGPDGGLATIAEVLNQTNEVLDDMVWLEGNLPTGNRTTIRTGIPTPTWRRLYQGVDPGKSETVQIDDSCGMLENYNEIDCALANMAPNPAGFRLSEARATIEGFGQTVAQTVFYGNEGTNPATFTGFGPRFNTLSATVPSSRNVISGSGAGSTNTSIWFVVWGPQTVHGIYPKGSKAGLTHRDLGEATSESAGGAGKLMQVYRSHFKWDCGLTVRDWRYIVRIANIDVNLLTKDAATGPDLFDLISQAFTKVPSRKMGRQALYCNQTIMSFLTRQQRFAKNVLLSLQEVQEQPGTTVMKVGGVPVRRVDQILNTEASVT